MFEPRSPMLGMSSAIELSNSHMMGAEPKNATCISMIAEHWMRRVVLACRGICDFLHVIRRPMRINRRAAAAARTIAKGSR